MLIDKQSIHTKTIKNNMTEYVFSILKSNISLFCTENDLSTSCVQHFYSPISLCSPSKTQVVIGLNPTRLAASPIQSIYIVQVDTPVDNFGQGGRS